VSRAQEIRKEIREHKAEMKASGYRVMSFMNGGQPIAQMRANERLFALKARLSDALRAESEPSTTCIEHAYGTTTRLSFQIKVF
jgi:archaeosine-15-forming tRNA-guanine transglycosylase